MRDNTNNQNRGSSDRSVQAIGQLLAGAETPVGFVSDGVGRYELVTEEKASGATYTPEGLADFVSRQIVKAASGLLDRRSVLRVLDPAVGEGALLRSLLAQLPSGTAVEVYGFETDGRVLAGTEARLRARFPEATFRLEHGDFLVHALDQGLAGSARTLFQNEERISYDLVIANPPYVRTQVLGAEQTQRLAAHFGLTGRTDLYHAFILGMAAVLAPDGVAGLILSNRFMTTRAGESVRKAIRSQFVLRHVWDLGDTKLFNAAVLPAVVLASGRGEQPSRRIGFTSIYESDQPVERELSTIISALSEAGVLGLPDGRAFRVRQGTLESSEGPGSVWRVSTESSRAWLDRVAEHTWRTFGDVGSIRVGVKTCADKVFIGARWDDLPPSERPELLRPLMTHHMARRYKPRALAPQWQILYPHERSNFKRQAVDLGKFPRSRKYLQRHRSTLEARTYVLEAGREWFELWVPQDPAEWARPKVVFRDISDKPCFWMDLEGSVVNGDCYWMTANRAEDEELLWLVLGVANSSFIEKFYDHRFNNKLYAGRRRFITQYVQHFPVPDPSSPAARRLVLSTKKAFRSLAKDISPELELEIDRAVYEAFGLDLEEVAG